MARRDDFSLYGFVGLPLNFCIMQTSIDILTDRRRIWRSKRILKRLYDKWCGAIAEALNPGNTLELGGGSGNLKDFFPHTISSDVVYVPWLDAVLDAHELPFRKNSFENIVLFDVLHHLIAPALFFHEAKRVLRPKGRIVIMEPYVSWCSFFVYRFLHAEGMNWPVDPFQIDRSGEKRNPFSGNQAIPTLMFEKYRTRFIEDFPRLKIIMEEKLDFFIYPLSGGFHNPSLCPLFLYPVLEYLERLLRPLNRFMAFRLFVVIEKNEVACSQKPFRKVTP
jgi:SAM-dependent methyltransferase